ncbi:DEAD-box ATP-dependent RNA helicase 37-like [Syzygium oleosum]|uniref:DEAD-box ATP-dependent RNA helicase 37-like n=1 Tax=Syzygium oleosum TaxID=219896 RepID=UPI0024BA5864|nr:DEAD-box ATP-dependent RNA helicase 37-like [Syzygium oleosum]
MAWNEPFGESSAPHRPGRPSRPFYAPPHVRRDDGYFGPGAGPAPARYRPRFGAFDDARPASGRGRGRSRGYWGGGGGGGGGRFAGRRFEVRRDASPERRFDDASEPAAEFRDLGVTEESGDGGGEAINFDAYENVPVEASGSEVPPAAGTFEEIDLGEALSLNIRRCKYAKPTPIQRHAIPIAVAGRDLMACAQTGSGKTAAYCLPMVFGVLSDGVTRERHPSSRRCACPSGLVLSPTRELACQIYEEAKKFAYQTVVKVAVAYGGAPFGQQVRTLEKGVDILVATPGRLVDMIERDKVSLRKIRYFTLDEADRMLDMGFEPQIRKIAERLDMPPSGARQTMLFSATFPDDIQRLASDFLSDYIFLAVGRVGSSTDLIAQKVEFVDDKDKRSYLADLLRSQSKNGCLGSKQALTLVFVETKRGADALENWLSRSGFRAIAIHGDKVQKERERALRSFRSGAIPIMVATDVAARGLDIPHVAHVINYDLPRSIDDYVHRIGRTGRAGKSGLATAFFSGKNMSLATELVQLMQEAKQEVPSWLSECAEQSCNGSHGRARNHRASRFGGNDFRRGAKSSYRGYSSSSGYRDAHAYGSSEDCYAHPPSTDVYGYAAADSYHSASHGYYDGANNDSHAGESDGYGTSHGSIVARGWE